MRLLLTSYLIFVSFRQFLANSQELKAVFVEYNFRLVGWPHTHTLRRRRSPTYGSTAWISAWARLQTGRRGLQHISMGYLYDQSLQTRTRQRDTEFNVNKCTSLDSADTDAEFVPSSIISGLRPVAHRSDIATPSLNMGSVEVHQLCLHPRACHPIRWLV
ncbi:hypothetical protein K456DRAFT_750920 [Colletotrichum gloeosporioides 23]|nr:hypothetical protein K456DRAFT_750920 [Colletotrichum gloeosporioides 23]